MGLARKTLASCSILTISLYALEFWIMPDSKSSLRKTVLSDPVMIDKDERVQCSALVKGDPSELQRAKRYMTKYTGKALTAQQIISMTKQCDLYTKNRKYILKYLTEEEKNFPIAYSIMIYKDPGQVERLLRAIYRPQNNYCLHVDKKSKAEIHEVMKSIASCFSNVFLIQNPVNVSWGGYTVLEPSILCLQELSKYKKWKYYINLSGQEFPIRTNFELVQIFKLYNGSSDVISRRKLMK